MAFAELEDVRKVYEGTVAEGAAEDRVQRMLDSVSARLRLMIPSLAARTAEDTDEGRDLRVAARDAVVNAVIRRIPGSTQQVRSQSQGVGPYSTTVTFTTDSSGTFSDEDLALLGGATSTAITGSVGTIHVGRVDWYAQ